MRHYTLDRYREAIDLAAEWECPYVVAIPGPVNSLINPPLPVDARLVRGRDEGAGGPCARAPGWSILLENVPFTFLPTAQDMTETAALIDP